MRGSVPLDSPLPAGELNRLRLRYRARSPSAGLGAHRHRRMGQSLEFNGFRAYVPGDDVRAMDWPATLRSGARVLRSFEAEERRRLILLVDCRPAMHLPEGATKISVALWIAQTLAEVALAERDQVVVVPLFAGREIAPVTMRSGRDRAALRRLMASLSVGPVRDSDWARLPVLEAGRLETLLRPAAAVVLLSDMLCADEDGRLAALARMAQRSYRSLHIVELDSWPMERAMLLASPFRLGALEGKVFDGAHRDAGQAVLAQAEAAMRAHREGLRRALQGPGLVWPDEGLPWPEAPSPSVAQVVDWFCTRFQRMAVLPSILSRSGR